MTQSLYIVERSAIHTLQHFFKKYDVSLPVDLWNDALILIIQSLMEIDVSQLIDASRYERNGARRAYRNGYRESAWIMNQQNIPLRIPKLRSGTYSPDFLNDSMMESLLTDTILQAYVAGVSFENLKHLLTTLMIQAHPSQIASLQENLYDLMTHYQQRDLTPSAVQLEVLPIDDKGRKRYLAIAFDEDELLDCEITSEADDEFWQDFVRRLDGRIIHGVEYVLVSRVHTVVRYARSNTPNMALAA